MRKISVLLTLVLLLSMLCACGQETAPTESGSTGMPSATSASTIAASTTKERAYTLDCGAALTAEYGLLEVAMDPFTTTLQGDNMIVMLLDEHKSIWGAEGITLEDYAYLVAVGNNMPGEFTVNEYGVLATEYTSDVNGTPFFYYASVHESGSSFWLCQMSCMESQKDTYAPLFAQWSATVTLQDTEAPVIDSTREKTYQLNCGMEITTLDGMMEIDMDGYDAFVTDNQLVLVLLKEEKYEGWTLDDYAAAVAEANAIDAFALNEAGIPAASYTAEVEGLCYYFYLTVHETEDAFWLCQFYTVESLVDAYLPSFPAWSASLKPAN